MYAKNAWEKYSQEELTKVMEFSEGYKKYITLGKTEREAVKESVKLLEERGCKELSTFSKLGSSTFKLETSTTPNLCNVSNISL